jgi:hypothetical protein
MAERASALPMKYDAKIHHRHSIRLHGYDYALPGAYFVPLCAFHKQCIFGRVVEDHMDENDCGKIAREQWLESAQIRQGFALDAFIVMPNHLHGILWILGPKGGRVLMSSGFGQSIVGADGVRPPDAQTRVGASRARPYKPRGTGGLPSRPCAPIRWPPGRRGSNRRLRVGFESFGIDRAPRCGKRIISNISFATRMNCSGFASTFSRTLRAGNWIGRTLRQNQGPKRNGPGTPTKRRAEWHSAGVVGGTAFALGRTPFGPTAHDQS